MQQPERRLYREHKYVILVLNDLGSKIAKADFRDAEQREDMMTDLTGVINLLHFHAQHEDEKIHGLLKKYRLPIVEEIEADHQHYESLFKVLKNKLSAIKLAKTDREKIDLGYQFYLNYRQFTAENLQHINKEEMQLMPELAKLCTEEELQSIDFPVYQAMNSEELVGMFETLFPVLNQDDKEYFIQDLIAAAPLKFNENWPKIAELLSIQDINDMAKRIELINRLSKDLSELVI